VNAANHTLPPNGIPPPQIVYASLIVAVVGFASTKTLFDPAGVRRGARCSILECHRIDVPRFRYSHIP